MAQLVTGKFANQRIPELDGLRGIAILMVISFHYINNQLLHHKNFLSKILCNLTYFGWVGVDLFFVLSGFLIGSILLYNKNSKNYFITFYIRRVVRIIPNYYLLICIFTVILAIPYFGNNDFLARNNVIPLWAYITMFHNIYMGYLNSMGNNAMSITWSIGIEEQFYIIFPFIVYFLKDRYLPYFLIMVIVAASIIRFQFSNWIPAYVLLPCRMDAISIGALIAYFFRKINLKVYVSNYLFLLLGVMLLDIIICGILYMLYGDLGTIKHTLFSVFFAGCLLLALAQNNNRYGTILRNKYLGWVGTISYSLYLFNYLILGMFHHLFGNTSGIGIYSSKDILVSILALITTFTFSWIVYKKMETPMVSWGKRFKY